MKTILSSIPRWGGRCRAALIMSLFAASVLFSAADVTISITLTDYQFEGVQHAAGTNNATAYFKSRCDDLASGYAAQKEAEEKAARDAKYQALAAEDKAAVDALIEEKASK